MINRAKSTFTLERRRNKGTNTWMQIEIFWIHSMHHSNTLIRSSQINPPSENIQF